MQLIGAVELNRKLAKLSGSSGRKVVRKAVRAGGAVYLKAARNAAPVGRTGLFKRSLTQVNRSYASKGVFIALVGQQKQKRFSDKSRAAAAKRSKGRGGISGSGRVVPIHLVENKTKRHRIPRRGKRLQVYTVSGRARFQVSAQHPGTRGTRFLAKAERTSRRRAEQAYIDKARTEINTEVAKL